MIQLDGIDYQVQTPEENALDMIQYVNQYCADNQVTNSKGELVQIDITNANPLFLLCFGVGYLVSIIQKLLYNCGCMFNIQAASPRQLLNLAEIAKVQRKDETPTTISAIIYSQPDMACAITTDMKINTSVGNQSVTLHPAFDITIAANSAASMVFIADTPGSFSIPANTITEFVENPTGFLKMTTDASVPGQAEESIQNLRTRLQSRAEAQTMIDRCTYAIESLPGVVLCSIYFNYSSTDQVAIGTTMLQPRTALLFVQGFSEDIAVTYYQYLTCLTQKDTEGRYIQQDYITEAGQHIPVYIIPPTLVPVYIRLYIAREIETTQAAAIQDAVLSIGAGQRIGVPLTAATLIEAVSDIIDVQGAELTLNKGQGYRYIAQPREFELIQFVRSNIDILVTAST